MPFSAMHTQHQRRLLFSLSASAQRTAASSHSRRRLLSLAVATATQQTGGVKASAAGGLDTGASGRLPPPTQSDIARRSLCNSETEHQRMVVGCTTLAAVWLAGWLRVRWRIRRLV